MLAVEAAKNSYSPYSNFPVGAVVEDEDGNTYQGCNVENASYGLTICAERNAMFSAKARGAKKLVRLAVTCLKGDLDYPDGLMPCGACRQVMAEFLPEDAEIIVVGVGTFKLKDLLPHPFTL